MYEITKYENIKNSKIINTLQVEDVFAIIKDGDDNLPLIKLAREYGKGSSQYDLIKANNLPTFRYNFLFEESATNKNITSSTGLIYIDVDENTVIPENEYVFASWKSLSGTGCGLLVKVDNLTRDNFNYVYDYLSDLIGVIPDEGARKATQQTVLSYDSNLYYNSNSIIFSYKEPIKVSYGNNFKKEKECLSRNDTIKETTTTNKVRFNNINDYFINTEKTFILFKGGKEFICNPFIPIKVEVGKRNSILFIYFSQILALNLSISKNYLKLVGDSINLNVMKPKLTENEINRVINSVFKKRDDGTLIMIFNQERRILFNPVFKLTHKEKMGIVNKELGQMRSEATKVIIYEIIEDWDFNSNGKITQKSVASISLYSIATIKRYWPCFKAFAKCLNNDFKVNMSNHFKMK